MIRLGGHDCPADSSPACCPPPERDSVRRSTLKREGLSGILLPPGTDSRLFLLGNTPSGGLRILRALCGMFLHFWRTPITLSEPTAFAGIVRRGRAR
jgi:hypothetical protein